MVKHLIKPQQHTLAFKRRAKRVNAIAHITWNEATVRLIISFVTPKHPSLYMMVTTSLYILHPNGAISSLHAPYYMCIVHRIYAAALQSANSHARRCLCKHDCWMLLSPRVLIKTLHTPAVVMSSSWWYGVVCWCWKSISHMEFAKFIYIYVRVYTWVEYPSIATQQLLVELFRCVRAACRQTRSAIRRSAGNPTRPLNIALSRKLSAIIRVVIWDGTYTFNKSAADSGIRRRCRPPPIRPRCALQPLWKLWE